MSIETNIKLLNEDTEHLYRVQKIKFSSSKHITTPTKTIPLDRLRLKDSLNTKSRQLNEIFKRFTSEKIKEANEDNDKFTKIESEFNSNMNKVQENDSTFCFLDFAENIFPTSEEIEFMIDIAYCNSDITTIPTISQIKIKEENFSDFLNYLNNAIETIEQLNNKPIMGMIPSVAPKKVEDLLNLYEEKGINSFLLDLDGKNPITARMRIFRILKILNKKKLLDSSYIHGHNVGMRVAKIVDVIPAKDILGFGLGLNSLGEKRKIFHPNKAFLNYIKTNPENKFRLFNKEDYGYWKGLASKELDKIWPEDSSFETISFKEAKTSGYLQKAFNVEQLALASHKLREIVNEEPNKTLDFIKNKKYVKKEDIKIIENVKKKIAK
ncbi:MAG: hypothetical protein ABIJ18_04275 [archaeon]